MKRIIYILVCLVFVTSCKLKKEQSTTLKIMSYNIRHGLGLDTILDLSRSAKIIKSEKPDLCGLQEVDNFCLRSDSIGQTAYLSQKTNMEGTFGEFMKLQGGAYGMTTLSAKPIVSTKLLQLPDALYEPRIAIVQEIELTKDCNIVFANVHFDWIENKEGSNNRLSQAKALVNYINILNKAAIITGDFNCTPNSPTMQYFKAQGFKFVEKGQDNLSFQGENKVEIDHLIYRNSASVTLKKTNVELRKAPIVSDHRPLIVELEVFF